MTDTKKEPGGREEARNKAAPETNPTRSGIRSGNPQLRDTTKSQTSHRGEADTPDRQGDHPRKTAPEKTPSMNSASPRSRSKPDKQDKSHVADIGAFPRSSRLPGAEMRLHNQGIAFCDPAEDLNTRRDR